MKIFLPHMIAFMFLLSGCSGVPSEHTIQTAIAEIQLAQITITPVYTATPVYTSTPDIPPTPTQDIRQITINEAIRILNNGTKESYAEARIVLLKDGPYYDEETEALNWYTLAMIGDELGDVAPVYFRGISPNYSGVYNQEIKKTILQYMSYNEWNAGYLEFLPYHQTQEAHMKLPSPSIGMTAEEVRNSQWGAPDDINSTTTANSVTEQWVYGNGRYLYFEDGILTAIQE